MPRSIADLVYSVFHSISISTSKTAPSRYGDAMLPNNTALNLYTSNFDLGSKGFSGKKYLSTSLSFKMMNILRKAFSMSAIALQIPTINCNNTLSNLNILLDPWYKHWFRLTSLAVGLSEASMTILHSVVLESLNTVDHAR